MGMKRRRLVAKLLQTEHDWFTKMRDVGEPPMFHWGGFQAVFGGHLCGSLKKQKPFAVLPNGFLLWAVLRFQAASNR